MTNAKSYAHPLWAATAPPGPTGSDFDNGGICDIAVIGAGFTGCRAALELTRAGRSVRLLEANHVGFGASGRTGGQVIPTLRPDPEAVISRYGKQQGEKVVQAASQAAEELFGVVRRHQIDCEARQQGWIQVAHHRNHVPLIKRRYEAWRARGAPVEWLESEALHQRTGVKSYLCGWRLDNAGCIQPLAYARGLASAAIEAGAILHEKCRVKKLKQDGDGWRVHCGKGQLFARQVIVATNAYTDKLVPDLAQSVVPVYSLQVATDPLDKNLARQVLPNGDTIADTRRLILYFRKDNAGRFVMGGIGHQGDTQDAQHYAHLIKASRRIFPCLGQASWRYQWGGFFAVTQDALPHLHEPEPGLLIAVGFNGRGVALTSVVGRLLAERALGASSHDIAFPIKKIQKMAFHRYHQLGVRASIMWKGVRDKRELSHSKPEHSPYRQYVPSQKRH